MLATRTWRAKEYFYLSRDPIDYSLVDLYRDIVLKLTSHQVNDDKKCNSQIFCDILDQCAKNEFCMKVFTHALYANPKRSSEELSKLNSTLRGLPKSSDIIANKMLKFSYTDLSREYKSCLLYLAIFPQEQSIRQSTLIGRWVTEGLITKEDWPSSVHRANRCFDALIDQWLVYPADISTTGQVKSCMVGDLVHEFITKLARKQRIVETHLSHHLARHFSIFNDLRLRSSDGIGKFFQRLSESSQVSLLKVLDLEACHIFGEKYQHYLKDVCDKMLLLKYLSLKGTNITHLPREINNLHELEVLDIRQTQVPEWATVNLLLLKLKHLLAGHICPSPSSFNSSTVLGRNELFTVQIPDKIEKMVNVEVLSNVKARNRQDLKDIGKLWQLRKLGVVTIDKDSHLKNLLRTISDLHECIHSLSITLSTGGHDGTPSSHELPDTVVTRLKLKNPPKLLESLSISGTTQRVYLLGLLSKDGDSNKLAKVTLSNTLLIQENLKALAKLPRLHLLLLEGSCDISQSQITFNKEEFPKLNHLIVECSAITMIAFTSGSVPKLKKIVWLSLTSLSGIDKLPRLKELEFKGDRIPDELKEAIEKHKNKLKLNILN
ncbi:hypothetical protein PR202_gb25039 [Eleusine coracana subsp. coracana]|uniref:Uncharacterized protein n=1 Tax=Eleusine coracana subsp. coracana TaxID=191504 RepID=A0AAV5FMW3_ELECO|nr:hypothetical protein PR202_gb25039 [Eleusine coracana subsp. coracana]